MGKGQGLEHHVLKHNEQEWRREGQWQETSKETLGDHII